MYLWRAGLISAPVDEDPDQDPEDLAVPEDSEEPEAQRLILQGECGDPREISFVLDVLYQVLVLHWVYPVQPVIVATVLAILPYLLFRGLANRWGRWMAKTQSEK